MAISKIKIGNTAHDIQTTIANVTGLQAALDGKAGTAVATTSANGLMSSADKTKLNYTNVAYGECSTAAATAAKVVTLNGNTKWTLTNGSIIMVKFTTSNSASNVTLNVNNTGAYPIWYNNAAYTSTGTAYTGYANRVIVYMFNGTHWVWITSSYDANNTYSNASLGQGYATCSTAAATAAKTASISSYALTTGGIVSIKFTNAVPANATLNITSKGAKNIYFRGAKITTDVIKAGDTATFIYDGTQYQLISIDRWQNDIANLQTDVDEHINYTNNPHQVTLSQLGVTAMAAELNRLDGITATTAELNYVDGVTSNIQTQLNNKVPTSRTINNMPLSSNITLDAQSIGVYSNATIDTKLNAKVPNTRTVNGKALSSNITLSASDVSAYSKTEIDNMDFVLMDDIADSLIYVGDEQATASAPLNADTLGGRPANEYALKSEIENLVNIPSFVVLSQAEYDALATKDANTIYYIYEEV